MRKILLTLLVLSTTCPVLAQDTSTQLFVRNPQRNWDARQGTIDEATFSIRPKGIYAEVGIYLTFSAANVGFTSSEDLEVQFTFDLPEGGIITDSWLWVGDQIMRAQLIDRWTATETYEGIVNRREDPSLLVKLSPTRYDLRVYPLRTNLPRKVKITYLVPVDWTAAHVHIPLPFDWLDASEAEVETLSVLAWPDSKWRDPFLTGNPELAFEALTDASFGDFSRINLAANQRVNLGGISFEAGLDDGVFVSYLDTADDGFYQLAYLPAAFVDEAASRRKVALLFDYDAGQTDLSATEILQVAQSELKSSLTSEDLFNVMFSQVETRRASDVWLPATPAVIDSVFEALNASVLASYSNLPSLLADGISFIEENNEGGSLLVVSSSTAFSNVVSANRLVADLEGLQAPAPLPVMLFADIANTSHEFQIIDGTRLPGNVFLYTTLAQRSAGQFETIRAGTGLPAVIRTLLAGTNGAIQAFDLYTTLGGGFTYGRFTSGGDQEADVVPIHKAVTQVGRYIGDLPFVVEASGVLRGAPFSNQLDLSEEEVFESDSTITAYWTGRQIDALEQRVQDENTIVEIIGYSLDARVISLYTAFLALEPGLGDQEPCGDFCEDETELVANEDEGVVQVDVDVQAYPNPFASRVIITVTFPEALDHTLATFEVFNAMGQRVRTLQPVGVNGRVIELIWDGTTAAGAPAANGIYFFVMTSPYGKKTLKLVLLR